MRMPSRLRLEDGLSLIEGLIGIVLLSVALLSLTYAAANSARQIHRARQHMSRWTAVQHQLETLLAQDHDAVASGSAMVQGFPVSWTVSGSDPKQVQFVVQYPANSGATLADTLVAFIPDESS